MKHRLLALIAYTGIFATLAPDRAHALATDKFAHFGVAATAHTGCTTVGKFVTKSKWGSEIACFAAVNAAGVIKEMTDPYRGGTRDKTDIYANLAGTGFSFLMVSVSF